VPPLSVSLHNGQNERGHQNNATQQGGRKKDRVHGPPAFPLRTDVMYARAREWFRQRGKIGGKAAASLKSSASARS
jgi:hypothetical protein